MGAPKNRKHLAVRWLSDLKDKSSDKIRKTWIEFFAMLLDDCSCLTRPDSRCAMDDDRKGKWNLYLAGLRFSFFHSCVLWVYSLFRHEFTP